VQPRPPLSLGFGISVYRELVQELACRKAQQTCTPRTGLKPINPVFERWKTTRAYVYRATTAIGTYWYPNFNHSLSFLLLLLFSFFLFYSLLSQFKLSSFLPGSASESLPIGNTTFAFVLLLQLTTHFNVRTDKSSAATWQSDGFVQCKP
jgi:hypothetical protein